MSMGILAIFTDVTLAFKFHIPQYAKLTKLISFSIETDYNSTKFSVQEI